MDLNDLLKAVEKEIDGKPYGHISDFYLLPDRPPFFYSCKQWLAPTKGFLEDIQGVKLTKAEINDIIRACRERNTEKSAPKPAQQMLAAFQQIVSGKQDVATASSLQEIKDFAFDWKTYEKLTVDDIDPFVARSPADATLAKTKEKRWRIRAHVSETNQGTGVAFRLLPREIPSLRDLNLPSTTLERMIANPTGLILVCGPTGSGKSTTIASMVKAFASTRRGHIATLEDPIEYIFDFPDRLVTQQKVGVHVDSWESGIYDALRDKVELLVIGEIRESTSARAAIQAASSGHLVLASTHYTRATKVLSYIVNTFPAHEHESIQAALLDCLIGVFCINLLPGKVENGKPGVVPAYEIFINNDKVRNNLKSKQWNMINDIMKENESRSAGMISWQTRIQELLGKNIITADVAQYYGDKEKT